MKKLTILALLSIGILTPMTLSNCDKENPEEQNYTEIDCIEWVLERPGYEVWAGDTPINDTVFPYTTLVDGYNIDQYPDYHLIGFSDTTQSFSTGEYKYFVVVAKYQACIDHASMPFNFLTAPIMTMVPQHW